MATSKKRARRLWATYAFPGFRPHPMVRGIFGDPKARVIALERRSKKRSAAVSQRDARARAAGGDPVRQIPYHAALGRGARQGAQGRVCEALGQGPKLHQGPEVHAAVAPGEPHGSRSRQPQEAPGSQQAPEHGLPAQGVLRPALGLRARGLGAALLRQLVREPEVAATRALREVRQDDRASLG